VSQPSPVASGWDKNRPAPSVPSALETYWALREGGGEAGKRVKSELERLRDDPGSALGESLRYRQVMIPKGNTGKFRRLGIPTIADRVVQASLKTGAGAHLRGGFPAVLRRVPPKPSRSRRDRRD